MGTEIYISTTRIILFENYNTKKSSKSLICGLFLIHKIFYKLIFVQLIKINIGVKMKMIYNTKKTSKISYFCCFLRGT